MAAAASTGGGSLSILILALPVVVLIWLMVMQRRRQRSVNQAQSELTIGDEVMAAAGLYGTVTGLDGDVVLLEIAPGVVVRVNRRAIVPPSQIKRDQGERPTDTHGTGENA
ncbi:preprotein translocase subunit YajC [Ornithinimicrobium sp. Y1847]